MATVGRSKRFEVGSGLSAWFLTEPGAPFFGLQRDAPVFLDAGLHRRSWAATFLAWLKGGE